MSIQLTVMSLDFDSNDAPYTKVFDKTEITIGRLPNNDLVLDRPEVSAYHAKLRVTQSEVDGSLVLLIKDLGSSNGTMVENKSLRAQVEGEVQSNQRVIIGNYLIKPHALESSGKGTVTNLFDLSESEPSESHVAAEQFTNEVSERKVVGGWSYSEFSETAEVSAEESPEPQNVRNQEQSADDSDDTLEFRTDFEVELDDEQEEVPPAFSSIAPFGGFASGTAESESPESDPVSPASIKPVQPIGQGLSETTRLKSPFVETSQVRSSLSLAPQPEFSSHSLPVQSESPESLGGELPMVATPSTSAVGVGAKVFELLVESSNIFDFDLSATELFNFRGQVLHQGRGVPGVSISAGSIGRTVTDSEGRYEFLGVPEGSEFEVVAEHPGFALDCLERKLTLRADTNLAFTAVQLFAVSGVVKHRGQPLAGVIVDAGALGRRTTGADGSYSFTDIREGTAYTLHFRKDRFSFDRSLVAGTVSEAEAKLEVVATQLFTVSGKVSHNGKPLPGVVVDGGLSLGKTVTDAEGRYVFENVPEHTKYTLTAHKERFSFNPIR